ncbi:MAG: MFS transporter, partial [Spirochaetales bacterium]
SSAFWGLAPRYASGVGFSEVEVSLFMTAAIGGSAAMQWPLGRLSDRIDRRVVAVAAGLISVVSSVAIKIAGADFSSASGIMVWFGGFTLPLYALSIADVNDRLRHDELVAAAGTAVFVFGTAAGLAPVAAGAAMDALGPGGLFVFTAVVAGIFVVVGTILLRRRRAVGRPAKRTFEAVPRTTQAAARLVHRRNTRPDPAADVESTRISGSE